MSNFGIVGDTIVTHSIYINASVYNFLTDEKERQLACLKDKSDFTSITEYIRGFQKRLKSIKGTKGFLNKNIASEGGFYWRFESKEARDIVYEKLVEIIALANLPVEVKKTIPKKPTRVILRGKGPQKPTREPLKGVKPLRNYKRGGSWYQPLQESSSRFH